MLIDITIIYGHSDATIHLMDYNQWAGVFTRVIGDYKSILDGLIDDVFKSQKRLYLEVYRCFHRENKVINS